MSTFGVLGVSILSCLCSIGIIVYGLLNMILIFPKKGYIINPDKFDIHKDKIQMTRISTKEAIFLSIPILNIFYSCYFANKLSKTILKEFESYPGCLLSMTQEERKEFKKCKNIIEKIDYYSSLMDTINKSDIVDAVSFEVIKDTENNSKIDEENSILDEYKKLRNEVNDVNFSINNQDETNDFGFKMKK